MKVKFSALFDVNIKGAKGSTSCTSQEMSFKDFHNFIQANDWAPAIFYKEYRSSENFKSTNIIVADIDYSINFEDLLKRLSKFSYSITYTRNHLQLKHGIKCPRFRIVLILSESITSQIIFKKVINNLSNAYIPEMDKQAMDVAHFFFKSSSPLNKENSILKSEGQLFDVKEAVKAEYIKEINEDSSLTPNIKNYVEEFINNSTQIKLNHEWNTYMSKTAFSLRLCGKSTEYIIELLEFLADYPLDDTDNAALKSAFEKAEKESISENKNKKNKDRFLGINKILNEQLKHYHILKSSERIKSYLFENENQEVRYIDPESIEDDIAVELTKKGIHKSPADTKQHAKYFIQMKEPLLEEPPLFRHKNENGLTFKRGDFQPIEGKCPCFNDLLSRMSNSSAFCAFIWSIVEMKSYRQQYCIIIGNGQDGKSTIGNLLHMILGSIVYNETTSSDFFDKHSTSAYLGKRLIIFPDNSDQRLTTSDLFKSLTGDDLIKINGKFQKPFSKKLNLKILVTTNKEPKISSQKADQRRAIICFLSPFEAQPDSNYVDKLQSEIDAIMYVCKSEYERLTVNHGPILTDTSMNEILASSNEELFNFIFDELFETEINTNILQNDFLKYVKPKCKEFECNYENFKSWMIEKKLMKHQRNKAGKREWQGIKFIDPQLNHQNQLNTILKEEFDHV